jgi:hypothetical protein
MSLNLVHVTHCGYAQWDVTRQGVITPVAGPFAGLTLPERDVKLLSPVTQNQQLVYQVAHHRRHMIASRMESRIATADGSIELDVQRNHAVDEQ